MIRPFIAEFHTRRLVVIMKAEPGVQEHAEQVDEDLARGFEGPETA